jgi:hypothetical protein
MGLTLALKRSYRSLLPSTTAELRCAVRRNYFGV